MFAPDADPPPAVPAATLVIFRHGPAQGQPEVLMVQRAKTMSFAGGAAVFPGGRVDPADHDLAARLCPGADPDTLDETAARVAAVRETLEETGLALGITPRPDLAAARRARDLLVSGGALEPVLAAMGWTLDLDSLVPFARWRPNHRDIRVFDTRFYLADLGTGAVDLAVDSTENTHLFWASAAAALAMAERDEIKIIYPTRRNLERLALFDSFAAARAHAEAIPVRTITPFAAERGGQPWLLIPADAGYPVDGEPLEMAARA